MTGLADSTVLSRAAVWDIYITQKLFEIERLRASLGPGRGRPAISGSAPPRYIAAAVAACQPGDPERPGPRDAR
jgi:hypothetical protein